MPVTVHTGAGSTSSVALTDTFTATIAPFGGTMLAGFAVTE